MFKVCIECNVHKNEWTTQSFRHHIPEGNMAICAGILLSGMTYNGVSRAMDIIGISNIGERRFYQIQKLYLFPAIDHVYDIKKKLSLNNFKKKP